MTDPSLPASGSAIIGTGHYRPDHVLTNIDLESMVETSDEWIRRRTGIEERHIAAESETVAQMATHAARAALEDADIDPSEITQVIVATCSDEERSPSAAGRVAQALGLSAPPPSTSAPPAPASATPWPSPTRASVPGPPGRRS
ncbi:hypothetical protein [Brachybacterium alimentarium]|uniref:hypothetical protein n=1 Tax=Brachybacterium alimentarium TaxID=47845 RepID=UPI003FD00944